MAVITFSSLKLKTPTEADTFDFMGKTIEVYKFVPVESKLDILAITMQKAKEGNIYNPLLLDVFFHLNLVYMYTNITFTDKQREDELKLFDLLESNNFFEPFIQKIKDDYIELRGYLDTLTCDDLIYNNSAANVIRGIIQDLPTNAEAARLIVDSFDPTKYSQVLNFAKAANGGRPVPGVADLNVVED
jgi:hypothetical protein